MSDEGVGPAGLVRLATWLSPAFPVGAFAYSHGLEAGIADGLVENGGDAADWIGALLEAGSGWNDLVLFAEGFRAANDPERLAGVAALAGALAGSRERRLETSALGRAFGQAILPWGEGVAAPYPVAVALAAARGAIPLGPALAAYANAFAASLVSAATRLVPLGQSGAVRILKELEPVVLAAAARAAASTLDDLGTAAILSDIAAMRHETLGTRLFRS